MQNSEYPFLPLPNHLNFSSIFTKLLLNLYSAFTQPLYTPSLIFNSKT